MAVNAQPSSIIQVDQGTRDTSSESGTIDGEMGTKPDHSAHIVDCAFSNYIVDWAFSD